MSRLEYRRPAVSRNANRLPNYSAYGYRITHELGRNLAGGRVTYLATDLKTQQQVVIKQFQFAKPGSSWADYDAHQREIEILRRLDHPGIPRYLGSILTQDGFCMVQEYKDALSLAEPRSFTPKEIQTIAVSVLEILIYLQNLIPTVIHGDIRPENILVDDNLSVYLVDFGFAHIGSGDVDGYGIRGTLGFMSPEQFFDRQLTEASDLYSLGITLLCLTTGTRSIDVGKLVDINYRVKFKSLGSKLNTQWVNWLKRMVAIQPDERFPSAAAALSALPGDLILPEATFSQSSFKFTANRLDQTLTQTIQIRNPVPNTLLGGVWEVAPHPSDPPHLADSHPWIWIEPAVFDGNEVECQITVNTSKLMSNRCYNRKLLLRTNALAKTYTFPLQVQTAPIPVRLRQVPYGFLGFLLSGCTLLTWLVCWMILAIGSSAGTSIAIAFGTIMGAAVGFELIAWMLAAIGAETGAAASVVAGVIVGLAALSAVTTVEIPATGTTSELMIGALTGLMSSSLTGTAIGLVTETLCDRRLNRSFSLWTTLLTAATGASLGLGCAVGFAHAWTIALLTGTGLSLTVLLVQFRLTQIKFISDYRKAERHLIKS
jgi:serine/threonine protein kinase